MFRHFTDEGVDPFEVRRRVGAVDVAGLEVLDLGDKAVLTSLGLTLDDLTGDDYVRAQEVADACPSCRLRWHPGPVGSNGGTKNSRRVRGGVFISKVRPFPGTPTSPAAGGPHAAGPAPWRLTRIGT